MEMTRREAIDLAEDREGWRDCVASVHTSPGRTKD